MTSSSSGTIITSSGQAISIRSANSPLNRLYSSIYTFAITKPDFVVSTLEIQVPSDIVASEAGIACGYQNYIQVDNYFNLKLKEGTNILSCAINGQKITISGLTTVL